MRPLGFRQLLHYQDRKPLEILTALSLITVTVGVRLIFKKEPAYSNHNRTNLLEIDMV